MLIMWTLEAVAFFFLPNWWAFAILGIGLFVHLANNVEEDMKVYDRVWEADREIRK